MSKERIEALMKRETALRAALAAERMKQAKLDAKDLKKEFATVGEVLVLYSRQSAEFKTMLKQVLPVAAAVADESAQRFLKTRGWI